MASTILVPVDDSEAAGRALAYATALAQTAASRLLLVTSARAPAEPGDDARRARAGARDRAEADLTRLASRLRSEGLAIDTAVYDCTPEHAITDAAHSRPTDLIVMGTAGAADREPWFWGTAVDYVLRQVEVPVFLVPADCPPPRAADLPARLLVLVDGAAQADDLAPILEELTAAHDLPLVLLGIVAPPRDADVQGYALDAAVADEQDAAAHRLDDLAGDLRDGGHTVEVWTEVGDPAVIVDATARAWSVDAIAVATHGRGALAHLVLERSAGALLRQVHLPLLILPTSGVRAGAAGPSSLSGTAWRAGRTPRSR